MSASSQLRIELFDEALKALLSLRPSSSLSPARALAGYRQLLIDWCFTEAACDLRLIVSQLAAGQMPPVRKMVASHRFCVPTIQPVWRGIQRGGPTREQISHLSLVAVAAIDF